MFQLDPQFQSFANVDYVRSVLTDATSLDALSSHCDEIMEPTRQTAMPFGRTIIRRLSAPVFFVALLGQPGPVQAEPAIACLENSRAAIVAAASNPTGKQRIEVVSSFSRAPAGGPAELVVASRFPLKDAEPKLTYRIAFQLGRSEHPSAAKVRLVESRDITASVVSETDFLRKSNAVEQDMTLLSFVVPEILAGDSILQGGMITVIGCNGDAVVFVGRLGTVYSNRVLCLVAAAVVSLVLYILVAVAVANYENIIREPPLSRCRFLDPVVLSSGPNGKGSVSRLQILFFSVLLFALLLYILLRVGLLSDMSTTVLLLLGISGVGATVSRGVDTQRNCLKFENRAWLINKLWLPPKGVASVNVAQWRDIVTGSDGFDVYHFQMLIFSLVVGVALLQVGFTDLADFKIPDNLLAVLGLSQALYIGGKLVEPTSTKDLDEALDKLRASEETFATAAVQRGLTPPVPPAAPAYATVSTPEYREFAKQRDIVKTMFESLFGTTPATEVMEPRYL